MWRAGAMPEAGKTVNQAVVSRVERVRRCHVTRDDLLQRVSVDPAVCAGKPCIRGTRIYIAIILDALAEGLSVDEILDHYPSLESDDVRAAMAYAADLARENLWKIQPA
jgi:uncharacterized protein (DUF433 family)